MKPPTHLPDPSEQSYVPTDSSTACHEEVASHATRGTERPLATDHSLIDVERPLAAEQSPLAAEPEVPEAVRVPSTAAAPKWVAWWKLPIVYFMGSLGWEDLMEGGDFPLFFLLFLLVLWWTFRNRRFLPLSLHDQMMERLKPLKRRWRAFHIRIRRGKSVASNNTTTTICKCCGEIFQGNYCPRCGQRYDTRRYRMSNALQNIAGGFFNIDTGFGRTLVALFFRPGHLIRDFINGRRVCYFRPFQMLFILAAIYIMCVQLIDPDALRLGEKKEEIKEEILNQANSTLKEELKKGGYQVNNSAVAHESSDSTYPNDSSYNQEIEEATSELLEDLSDEFEDGEKIAQKLQEKGILKPDKKNHTLTFNDGKWNLFSRLEQYMSQHPFTNRIYQLMKGWFHGNKAFLIILTLPLLALSCRFVFRKKRYSPHYNFTEHLFVQAYIACQLLMISIVVLAIQGRAHVDALYEISYSGMAFLFCLDFKQLYGLDWWSSLWRTFKMFIVCFFLLTVLATIAATVIITFAMAA